MQVRDLNVNKKIAQGVEIPLPNSTLIMGIAPKGYVACSYFNITVAEKLGDCAATVKGIKSIDELLTSKVVEVTSAARKRGIKPGMSGSRALAKMF